MHGVKKRAHLRLNIDFSYIVTLHSSTARELPKVLCFVSLFFHCRDLWFVLCACATSLVPRLSTHISPWKAWDIITREWRRGRRKGGRKRRALDQLSRVYPTSCTCDYIPGFPPRIVESLGTRLCATIWAYNRNCSSVRSGPFLLITI